MDHFRQRPQTDEHGNPIHHTHGGHETGAYGTATAATGHHQGKLHRTGSSSSSEDDGQGGRRKKGIKDKIKEKMPGKHNDQAKPAATATTTTPVGGAHEKKGIMDKIKDKIPGRQQ